MDLHGAPVAFVVFLLFISQPAGANSPTKDSDAFPAYTLGASVNIPVQIPKESFFDISLNSVSTGEAVALWTPGNPTTVLSPNYAERVSFLEETQSFQIRNLSLEDGGVYQVLMNSMSKSTLLKKVTLFVFSIHVYAKQFPNSSCVINLDCQAGVGKHTHVSYSWKHRDTGVTASQDSWLHLVLNPKDTADAYTCSAVTPDTQKAWDVTPYSNCRTTSGAAGHFVTHDSHAKAALASVLVAFLMLP